MTRRYNIPGAEAIELDHLLLDVNGTLADRGRLIPGVDERLGRLRGDLDVRLLSADTFGTLDELARQLGVRAHRVARGSDKAVFISSLAAERCAAIGNGRNDIELLATARLGIAVVGPEGASAGALASADVVCRSILTALDLLLDETAIASTLRP